MNKNVNDIGGNTNDNTFVALTVKGNINANEGDSTPHYRGDYEGINVDIQCQADWLRGCNQMEIDHGLFAGMHARSLFHIVFTNQTNDAAHGAFDDAFLGFLGAINIVAGTGQRTSIFQIGTGLNVWPLDPTLSNSGILTVHPFKYNDPVLGNLGVPASPTQYYAGFGFDLAMLNAGTAVLRSPGFLLDGSGQLSLGPITSAYDASGNATFAATRVRETSAVVNVAGNHYQVGDEIADTNGGLWTVATLTGTGIATVTQLRPGYATSCPGAGNVVTGGSGQLATLNITCTSTLGNLILGASTHNVRIGGGSALATNATTGMLLIPSMAGTPTGNVGALGGVALNYDSTNKKLCVTIGATVECTAAMTP
jgi:hypothetical protein